MNYNIGPSKNIIKPISREWIKQTALFVEIKAQKIMLISFLAKTFTVGLI